MQEHQTVGLTFANYNYAFSSFYDQYKKLCITISEKEKLEDLIGIRKAITTFIYENEYTLEEKEKRINYHLKLQKIKNKADEDYDLKKSLTKDLDYMRNIIIYRRKYYEYFLEYLSILGEFVSELSSTYMPNTNLQRKLLRFSNKQLFFEKFTQHKEKVIESLVDFNIRKFTIAYNQLITFFFAYSLFVNEQDKAILNDMFSYALSYYLDHDNLRLISKPDPSPDQTIKINKIESGLHKVLLFCLSVMNQSFSNYDVLPKLRNKVYIDRTLI